ncbi:V-type proton ATPase subunit G, partial [Fragariocoptes setiger]
MSNQHSQEVQLLLAAEKKASEKVAEARKRKARRLKQAKEEATAEIEQFKRERQAAFQKYETEHMGSREDLAKRIDIETAERLRAMEERIKAAKDKIIERLIEEVVTNVDPKLHKNREPISVT